MDASPAQPQDVRDVAVAELAQKLLAQLSGPQDVEERTLDVAAIVEDIPIAVRRLINATRPVNQLPAEVLGRIFSLIPMRRKYPILNTSTTNVQDVITLLPLLSVCSWWRDVARSASFLWDTVIDLPNVPLRQDYLSLCPSRPIYVASKIEWSLEWLLRLLREQETRVEELYVKREVNTDEHVHAILQLSLPALQRCIVDGDGDRDLEASASQAALLPNSKALQALRLRELRFIRPTTFPVLTTLHLERIEDMRLLDLLRFLAGTPLLQDLRLTNASPETRGATDLNGWRHGRVQLRDLRRLVVEDHDYDMLGSEWRHVLVRYQRGLLSNLSVSLACAHAVGGVAGSGLAADLLSKLWPVEGLGQRPTHARILFLSPSSRHQRFVLQCSADDGLDASFGLVTPNDTANTPPGATIAARLAKALYAGPAFRNIKNLRIGQHLAWLYHDIGRILCALPAVEAIMIDGCMLPTSFHALIEDLTVSPNGTVQFAPSLSILALDFGTVFRLKPPSEVELGSAGVGAVYEMQRSRAAAGHPLRRLIHFPEPIRREAHDRLAFEFDANGVLVRKEPWAVVLQELDKTWARDGFGHGRHLALIERDIGSYWHGDCSFE
ncbi:uncharacterized protein TRAVEDRAFT_53928 [Trametes versicolor FP-101664 SS1]|uniref:Uncharacterized protein n=1 Tax=Trametes versicolor (strain FP-101664) TaxID=717944 RepID=R7S7C4_TRAVS|nr:uncharacterized protein TRAVEDRAFT_53928 [Trametes versicolor FP-101664 SS1]EIW51933.1 hypothetical protein TRAVEDRAFT_53928 [Trametes versicolor FP-101664 SS1]